MEGMEADPETPETAPEDQILSDKGLQTLDQHRPEQLTVLPLLQRPVFPGLTIPIGLQGGGIPETVRTIMRKDDGYCALVLANRVPAPSGGRGGDGEEVEQLDYRAVGTLFRILRVIPVNDTSVQVLGQSLVRCRRRETVATEPVPRWRVTYQERDNRKPSPDLKAYMMAVSGEIKSLIALNPHFKEQVNLVVDQLNYEAPGLTLDVLSNILSADAEILQTLLENYDPLERAREVLGLVKQETELAKIQQRINNEISDTVSAQQKEFFLREQLKAIKKELGIEKDGPEAEVESLEERLAEVELNEEARRVVDQELRKLATLNAQSPEFNVTRSYLELVADLPWGRTTDGTTDVKRAREILERDHYGLQDVKDNILEFLATIIRRGQVAGSIICLVGPPGVGKTSIGKSIAEALGRKFFRFSVGGMRDEAEIKGHRRTYIGAMPGKPIQALKRVQVMDPVIMLDEIDKIGSSYQGDPASALLELLDPEQNDGFLDHYLDLPFDLSKVLFITTANTLDTIPRPLLDRMEVIRLSGYIKEEKVQIAGKYLVPKELRELGFEPEEVTFEEGALDQIVDNYAREAGVRSLEMLIRKILRKVNLELAEDPDDQQARSVTAAEVVRYLGKPVFNTEELYNEGVPGVALGLAYTTMGGATLYVEASGSQGERKGFRYTGQLGDVMKESADIAYSYVRQLSQRAGNNYFAEHFVHLHVPAGATPKDGPSAGITMALALYSLATDRPVRDKLAMTGELTLTGKVLPIGGVREKTIGARRVDVDTLIFPKANQSDYEELPEFIRAGITVHFADYFLDVLAVALPEPDSEGAAVSANGHRTRQPPIA